MASGSSNFELSITLGEASFSASGAESEVKEAFQEFKALLAEAKPETSSTSGTATKSGNGKRKTGKRGGGARRKAPKPKVKSEKRDPIDASKVTLPQLLNEADFGTNPEIGAAIVIWAAEHEKKDPITNSEIEDLWKGTNARPPGNIRRDLSKAKKNGWISSGKDGHSPLGYGRSSLGFK